MIESLSISKGWYLASLKFHFLVALLIRLAFTFYGFYHDRTVEFSQLEGKGNAPKYTDIDYNVFTDAAKYIYEGESPYLRETYRYTPILALVLQPNIFLIESFGKFLFLVFDLLCGLLILKINRLNKADKSSELAALCFWFYNPITITIASRGNAESIMSFLVLAFILLLRNGFFFMSGLVYALSIHFKIYPVTYGLAVLFYLIHLRMLVDKTRIKCVYKRLFVSILLNKDIYKFGFSFLFTIAFLTFVFYVKYGNEFLNETYLYHLGRQDIRHNFSPYFYMLYLTDLTWQHSILLKFFNFLPQCLLLIIFSFYLHDNIEICLFFITYVFVTFNKVCTSQYFVWYLCLIPIIIPRLKISLRSSISFFLLWLLGQAIWLFYAFKLEFRGENTFLELWLASLLFAAINCFIMKYAFLDTYAFYDLEAQMQKAENKKKQ